MDNAETADLLQDPARQVMALRAADDSSPHAYAVRNGSKRGPGRAIVSATVLTEHYGIGTTATRRWKHFAEDGMLRASLTEEGTVSTGARAKTYGDPTPTTEATEVLQLHNEETTTEAD